MKLLFVSTNRLRRVMPPPPLGLASVIAQVDGPANEIRVVDLMWSADPAAELEVALAQFAPDVIALSVRNVDNQCYTHTQYLLPEVKELIALCRRRSDASVVVGGPAFTVSPRAIFEYLGPDFGVVGEGEIAFRELVSRLERGSAVADLPGLVLREGDRVRENAPAYIDDFDSLAAPRRDLFDNQRYAAEGGIGNIVIKQGCPFRCLYCDSPHTMGSAWRMKSPNRVADELESVQKDTGVEIVYFTDAIFNHPPDYAAEVCDAIARRKLAVRWVASVHPAFIRNDLLERMREAGCRLVSLGCDSASERMLAVLRKDFTKADLARAADMLERMGLSYLVSILIGGPGEDRETVEETVDFFRDRNPVMTGFCVGIRLMPHTRLASIAVEEGVIAASDPLMEPRFYVSAGVRDWVEGYLAEVCAQRSGWSVGYE